MSCDDRVDTSWPRLSVHWLEVREKKRWKWQLNFVTPRGQRPLCSQTLTSWPATCRCFLSENAAALLPLAVFQQRQSHNCCVQYMNHVKRQQKWQKPTVDSCQSLISPRKHKEKQLSNVKTVAMQLLRCFFTGNTSNEDKTKYAELKLRQQLTFFVCIMYVYIITSQSRRWHLHCLICQINSPTDRLQ